MSQPGNAALNGVRVLDFSRVLAGPFCTMILGDLGADVIKIERPGTGDDTRAWGPPWSGPGANAQSAYFLCANRNKRSLTLNLKSDIGRDLARRLAAQSQIVVENFMPGQMASYGLGFEDLRDQNPAVVYCSITGFGQSGPYHDRPGYDYVIQAMSGLMSITGPVEGDPVKVGGHLGRAGGPVRGDIDPGSAASRRGDGRGPAHRHFAARLADRGAGQRGE